MSSELRFLWESAGGSVPAEWPVMSLESLLRDPKSIAVGVMYPGPDTPGGVPLIKVGDISGGAIHATPSYRISAETNYEHRRTQLDGDELLITLVGNPGECVIVQPHMKGWNPARAIAALRLKDSSLRVYLKTVLESRAGKHLIDAVLNTTVQKTLNLKDIKRLPIPLPPPKVVRGITQVAEALTDRIALLRETNATLEAIAQALFKSWFIDFDPVHARARGEEPAGLTSEVAALFPDSFEESELGLVPKGWNVGLLGEVAETVRKQVQPESMTADTLYVGLEHIPRQSLGLDAWGTAEELESAKSCFEKGDVLFGKLRPYFHKIVIAPFDGVCSTDILVCRAKSPEYYAFVLMHLFSTELVSYADRLSNGAKMPRVNWKDLAAYQVTIPPTELALTYVDVVKPMFAQITDNVLQAQTLATLRDTLLPRLISGQLRLPEAEAALQEVGI
ncbi:hypothetical protein [Aeromonas veronii]